MRRVIALALGVVLIGSVLLFGVRALPAQDGGQAAPVAAPTAAPTVEPHEGEDAHEEPVSDPVRSKADRDLATAFMAVYASGPTEAERPAWNAEMTRLCTPDIAEGLHWAEAERLPVGTPTGAALVEEAHAASAVEVTLDNGETWLVVLNGEGLVMDVLPS